MPRTHEVFNQPPVLTGHDVADDQVLSDALSREDASWALPAVHDLGRLAGMSMTEKQGGSDVRASTTRAVRSADGSYRLTGHKWFTSAPMCDLFLVLAQAPGGLSCFLVPRVLPDSSHNNLRFQRLKDKLLRARCRHRAADRGDRGGVGAGAGVTPGDERHFTASAIVLSGDGPMPLSLLEFRWRGRRVAREAVAGGVGAASGVNGASAGGPGQI